MAIRHICLPANGTRSSFRSHHVRVWGPPDLVTPASVLTAVIAYCPHSRPFQGRDAAALSVQIRRSFWPALRMNWRVWTPVQFININYVPLQVRASWRRAEPEGPSSSPSLVSWNDRWFSLHPEALASLDQTGKACVHASSVGPRNVSEKPPVEEQLRFPRGAVLPPPGPAGHSWAYRRESGSASAQQGARQKRGQPYLQ